MTNTIRRKLDAALSVIVYRAIDAMCHLRFRINRENKRLQFIEEQEELKKLKAKWNNISWENLKKKCGLSCARNQEQIVDWMIDEYIDKIHEHYHLFP